MPYRQVDVRFWEELEIQALAPEDRDALMYYMTNPHSNMLGLYRIPQAYVAEDRHMSIEACEKSTQRLVDLHLLKYDVEQQLVFLPTFLSSNKIVGTKQEKGAIGRLILLPPTPLLKDLKEAVKRFLPNKVLLLGAFDQKHLPLRENPAPKSPVERAKNARRTDDKRPSIAQEQEQDKDKEQEEEQAKKKTSRRKKPATARSPSPKQAQMARITEKYKELKEIEPKGKEWLPIQRTIKFMLTDGRTEAEIITCMEAFAEAAAQGCEWLQNWTIHTVRLKLPEYTSGVLTLEGGQSIRDRMKEERLADLQKELESAAHVVTAVENHLARLSWQKDTIEHAEEKDRLEKRLVEHQKLVRSLQRKIKKED